MSSSPSPTQFDRAINMLQLVTLVIGIIVVSAKVGARDEVLTRNSSDIVTLQSLVNQLALTQAASQAAASEQNASLRRDIDRLLSAITPKHSN